MLGPPRRECLFIEQIKSSPGVFQSLLGEEMPQHNNLAQTSREVKPVPSSDDFLFWDSGLRAFSLHEGPEEGGHCAQDPCGFKAGVLVLCPTSP